MTGSPKHETACERGIRVLQLLQDCSNPGPNNNNILSQVEELGSLSEPSKLPFSVRSPSETTKIWGFSPLKTANKEVFNEGGFSFSEAEDSSEFLKDDLKAGKPRGKNSLFSYGGDGRLKTRAVQAPLSASKIAVVGEQVDEQVDGGTRDSQRRSLAFSLAAKTDPPTRVHAESLKSHAAHVPASSNVEARDKLLINGNKDTISNWSSLFTSSSSARAQTKLKFFTPEVINGEIIVCPPREIAEEGARNWEGCLIG